MGRTRIEPAKVQVGAQAGQAPGCDQWLGMRLAYVTKKRSVCRAFVLRYDKSLSSCQRATVKKLTHSGPTISVSNSQELQCLSLVKRFLP